MRGENGDRRGAGFIPLVVLVGGGGPLHAHGLEGSGGQAQRGLDVLQGEGEFARRLVAPLVVFRHGDREDTLKFRGHIASTDGGNRGAQHPVEHGEFAVVSTGNLEGRVARQDAVHGGSQGVDVDRGPEGACPVLLFGGRPRDGEPAGCFLVRSCLRGDAEVSEDRVSELCEQDIHGLHVAVNDPALVKRLDRSGDAHTDVERLRHGDPVLFGALAQVRGRTVFHDQVVAAVVRDSRRVKGHDGRVVGDAGHQVDFRVEGGRGLGIGVRSQDLDCHVTLGHLLAEQVDVGEAARAEVADERRVGNRWGVKWPSHYSSIRNEISSPSSTTSPGLSTVGTFSSRRTGACPGRVRYVPLLEPRSCRRTSQSSIRSSQWLREICLRGLGTMTRRAGCRPAPALDRGRRPMMMSWSSATSSPVDKTIRPRLGRGTVTAVLPSGDEQILHDEAWVAFGWPFSHKTARTCGPTAAGEECAAGEACADAACGDSSGSEVTLRA